MSYALARRPRPTTGSLMPYWNAGKALYKRFTRPIGGQPNYNRSLNKTMISVKRRYNTKKHARRFGDKKLLHIGPAVSGGKDRSVYSYCLNDAFTQGDGDDKLSNDKMLLKKLRVNLQLSNTWIAGSTNLQWRIMVLSLETFNANTAGNFNTNATGVSRSDLFLAPTLPIFSFLNYDKINKVYYDKVINISTTSPDTTDITSFTKKLSINLNRQFTFKDFDTDKRGKSDNLYLVCIPYVYAKTIDDTVVAGFESDIVLSFTDL